MLGIGVFSYLDLWRKDIAPKALIWVSDGLEGLLCPSSDAENGRFEEAKRRIACYGEAIR